MRRLFIFPLLLLIFAYHIGAQTKREGDNSRIDYLSPTRICVAPKHPQNDIESNCTAPLNETDG
jgi:hypothetical protein